MSESEYERFERELQERRVKMALAMRAHKTALDAKDREAAKRAEAAFQKAKKGK